MKYKSKIDWWIPLIVVVSVICCCVGPMIEGDMIPGIILGTAVLLIEIFIFAGVEYEIRDGQLGVRNFFVWTWFPVDKIVEITPKRSYLTAAALSFDRLAITFSDKRILKSSMPLEVSPKDRDRFIKHLKDINVHIKCEL